MTLKEASVRVGVTPGTLRRWTRQGLIPQHDGVWTSAAIGQARVVAKMRERGHSLAEIRRATDEGKLAFGFLQDLFPTEQRRYSIAEAAQETGIEPALVDRLVSGLGITPEHTDTVSEDELQLLRYVGAVLESGFPLVALLQLVRVYGQAMAHVADAEVRLFHLYVHEPLMRSGSTGVETAEQMNAISRQVLPLAGPVLDQIHQRYLQFFVEQDVVGHMETDLDGSSIDLGRMRVPIAFADLAGYTRLTEEEGELTAVDAVERFVDAVE
ncbi:MAG TPA: MerR family transcriptional regulator, partial [Solirubrobacteraceae bacterium]|nr:MerR family transcriptional regulator [Solirubrobacteraceae bacterium]